MRWPTISDLHKAGKPEIPDLFGIFYVIPVVLTSFLLFSFENPSGLAFASVVLFGGFIGMMDDIISIQWRWKALLPLIPAIPLAAMREGNPIIHTFLWWVGPETIDLGILYFILFVPLVVTITTNSINQVGGLNGLESTGSLIIMTFLFLKRPSIIAIVPLLVLLLLSIPNLQGRIFVGNVGSFAFGVSLASYAIIYNIEQTLAIALTPYIINSVTTLIAFATHRLTKEGDVTYVEGKGLLPLSSWTLRGFVMKHLTPNNEHRTVFVILMLVTVSSFIGYLS